LKDDTGAARHQDIRCRGGGQEEKSNGGGKRGIKGWG